MHAVDIHIDKCMTEERPTIAVSHFNNVGEWYEASSAIRAGEKAR